MSSKADKYGFSEYVLNPSFIGTTQRRRLEGFGKRPWLLHRPISWNSVRLNILAARRGVGLQTSQSKTSHSGFAIL